MKDKNDIFLQNLNLIVIMQKAVPLPEFQTGEEVSEAVSSGNNNNRKGHGPKENQKYAGTEICYKEHHSYLFHLSVHRHRLWRIDE